MMPGKNDFCLRVWLTSASTILLHLISSVAAQKDCYGGKQHGTVSELGRYYYTCNDGTSEPTGCISSSTRQRAPAGGTFQDGSFEMKCVLGSDGLLSIEYNACVINGRTVQPGETYESTRFWYNCYRQQDYVLQEVMGCMHNGRRLKKYEKIRENGFIYECREKNAALAMCPTGCVVRETDYGIGQICWDDRLLYTCTTEDGLLKKKVIGCMKDGKQIKDGEKYRENDQIYKCEVQDTDATLSLFGCYQTDDSRTETEKRVGQRWTEGTGTQRFSVECQETTATTAVKMRVDCIYVTSSENRIQPGCFRKIDDQAVGCRKSSTGQLDFVIFEPTRLDIAYQNSFTIC